MVDERFPTGQPAEDLLHEVREPGTDEEMEQDVLPDSLQGVFDRSTGASTVLEQKSDRVASGDDTTGGDMYSNQEQAKVVGEEAVGGTTPTPDQNVAEDLAASMGIEIRDRKPLEIHDMMHRRDDQRWELDPQSSEDYENHQP